jgi:crotonobetainyl-CoA:carnitine CoA-transferase CaiB-like acyl-CoA transferase
MLRVEEVLPYMDARNDSVAARDALAALWHAASLPADALADVDLTGADPVLPSSFAVATAVQSALAAAALAAARIGQGRGGPGQRVAVDATHAVLDSCGWFRVDDRELPIWDKLSGLYACGARREPGWVRLHANFAHHRDGALKLLGLQPGAQTEREAVTQALADWRAEDFEAAAGDAGLVVAAARSFAQWDAHPQGLALAGQPALKIETVEGTEADAPLPWAPLAAGEAPLRGLRVLDLTRILAGPVAGRTLAAYGADVMLVNSPDLPNIEHIADTSRGKLSVHIDLRTAQGRDTLRTLVREADVFLQGYRPGALAALGFGPAELAALKPGIVCVSLSAYGDTGPWGGRRGFDSLVQTATGFNVAEAEAFGAAQPRAMPFQVLDYSAGYLLAFGAQAALMRQRERGGSLHAKVSLTGVGHWLRGLGRVASGSTAAMFRVADAPFERYAEDEDSGFGRLRVLRHAAQFSHTPAHWALPSVKPGTHPPQWPPR